MNSSLVLEEAAFPSTLCAPAVPKSHASSRSLRRELAAAPWWPPLALSGSAFLLIALLAWVATSGVLAPLGYPGELLMSGAIYPGAGGLWLLLGLPALADGWQLVMRVGQGGCWREGVIGVASILLAILSVAGIVQIAAAI